MKNKYINRSRISEAKFRQFVKYFTLDLEAQKIAILTRLNRNTVNRYLRTDPRAYRRTLREAITFKR
jgi:transposase